MSQPQPENEPRRVDAALQRILDRAAAMEQGRPDPKADQQTAAIPKLKPTAQHDPKSETAAEVLPARVPPSRRAQLEAMNSIAKRRGDVSEAKPISYYLPELIQCTLPHSEPKPAKEGEPKPTIWMKKNGEFNLIVTSGVNAKGEYSGIPYGAFPRLVLAYIITKVTAKPQRQIELSAHFSGFLKEVGYTGNLRGNTQAARHIKDQLERLLNAKINFFREHGDEKVAGSISRRSLDISPNYDLWWDYRQPEQGSLFSSRIEISEEFYNAILANKVPLRTDVLKELRNSPLAIDVYMWLSYRLYTMREQDIRQLKVTYGALQNQFGTGIAPKNYRQFRSELKQAFTKVSALWHHGNGAQPNKSLLQYEFNETSLFLHTSPLLIGRGDRLSDQDKAQAILERRQFDRETIIKARRYAGRWDVDRLQADYFQWLADKGSQPKNPEAHFIQFVKSHVKRNP